MSRLSPARFNLRERNRDAEKAERQRAAIVELQARESAGTMADAERRALAMLLARTSPRLADPLQNLNRRRAGAGLPPVGAV